MLVSVDVRDYSTPVVFDSYAKKHSPSYNQDLEENNQKDHGNIKSEGVGSWFTEYGSVETDYMLITLLIKVAGSVGLV